jgi:hypothetical protein
VLVRRAKRDRRKAKQRPPTSSHRSRARPTPLHPTIRRPRSRHSL